MGLITLFCEGTFVFFTILLCIAEISVLLFARDLMFDMVLVKLYLETGTASTDSHVARVYF